MEKALRSHRLLISAVKPNRRGREIRKGTLTSFTATAIAAAAAAVTVSAIATVIVGAAASAAAAAARSSPPAPSTTLFSCCFLAAGDPSGSSPSRGCKYWRAGVHTVSAPLSRSSSIPTRNAARPRLCRLIVFPPLCRCVTDLHTPTSDGRTRGRERKHEPNLRGTNKPPEEFRELERRRPGHSFRISPT